MALTVAALGAEYSKANSPKALQAEGYSRSSGNEKKMNTIALDGDLIRTMSEDMDWGIAGRNSLHNRAWSVMSW